MESFYTLWPENFIQNLNLIRELMRNLQKSLWKLSNIHEANFKILPKVWVLILCHKPIDHKLDNSWLAIVINLIDDLLLTIKMDGATHDDQAGIECILVYLRVTLVKELATGLDHLVVDALLLALMVHAHVAEYPKGQLANHLEIVV